MPFPNRLRILIPAVVLVALVAIGLGIGYYFASASTTDPRSFPVTWSTNPLNIRFQAGSTGSAPDSFTCSPSVSPVTLKAVSDEPDIYTLTVSPSAFSSCGSTPDNVVVNAACTPEALENHSCAENMFNGTVKVCGPTPYTCLRRHLSVVITVTSGEHEE